MHSKSADTSFRVYKGFTKVLVLTSLDPATTPIRHLQLVKQNMTHLPIPGFEP